MRVDGEPRSKSTSCQNDELIDLRGKEGSEQRVEAASAEVRHAEVDERQFFPVTHRSERNKTAAGFSDVCRWGLLRNRQCRARQNNRWRQRVVRQRR